MSTRAKGTTDGETHGTVKLPPFARPPWPEWSDEAINNDNVDETEFLENGYFVDPLGALIPPQVNVLDWVRPTDLFLDPVLLHSQDSELDLIHPNIHLCEVSTLIRAILCEISELYELALQRDFFCDGENIDYYPNSDHPWKPWDHIYSLNQAGMLGSKPKLNPKGRYFVRLYFMGSWRRITVDDRIPLVKYGLFGLPVTSFLELWPLILTKAILKVALATTGFQSDPEVRRFSTISCLTGWIHECQRVPHPVSADDLWQYMNEVLPRYQPNLQRQKLLRDFEFETDSLFVLKRPNIPAQQIDDKTQDIPVMELPKPPKKGKGKKKGKNKSDEDAGVTTADESVKPEKSKGKLKGKKKGKTKSEDDAGVKTADESVKAEKSKGKVKVKKKGKHKSDDDAGVTSADESVKPEQPERKIKGKQTGKGNETQHSEDEAADVNEQKADKETDGEADAETEFEAETHDTAEESSRKASIKSKISDDENSVKSKRKKERDKAEKIASTAGVTDAHQNELEDHQTCKSRFLPEIQTTPSGTLFQECRAIGLPSVDSMCVGVKKHLGPLQHGIMVDLEKQMGRDLPFVVTAGFFEFPKDDYHKSDGNIPAHLQRHPVHLAQVRDCPLRTCGPPTPLWKTFRWKRWAMKKGIIPKDETFEGKKIRSILSKTPLMLNHKWEGLLRQTYPTGYGEAENDGEVEMIHDHPVGPIELPLYFKIPPLAIYEDLPSIINTAQTPAPTALEQYARNNSSQQSGRKGSGVTDDASASAKGSRRSSKDDKKSEGRSEKVIKTSKELTQKKSGVEDDGNSERLTRSKPKQKKERGKDNLKNSRSKTSEKSSKSESAKKSGRRSKSKDPEDVSREAVAAVEQKSPEVLPQKACGEIWADVEDVANKLSSITKFYQTKTKFGNFYILKRMVRMKDEGTGILKESKSTKSTAADPSSEKRAEESKRTIKPNSVDHESINSRRSRVTLGVYSWQMNNIDDLHAGFYLFSDCWTVQELIISVEVLNEDLLDTYVTTSLETNESAAPFEFRNRSVTVIMKPWDWRRECCLDGNVIVIATSSSCLLHVPLPPGRNLFRIWLLDEPSERGRDCGGDAVPKMIGSDPYFTVKILSHTPISIGTREQIQDLMTQETALFLRQADMIARSVWALLLSVGRCKFIMQKSMKLLRASYCPTPETRNPINDILRWTHDKFDAIFLSWVVQANGGKLHKWALLTAKVLLLNPTLGAAQYDPLQYPIDANDLVMAKQREETRAKAGLIQCQLELRYCLQVWECVAVVIQRYWRGWLTRRLFQVRIKGHKYHQKIDQEIRRIFFYLAEVAIPDFHPITDREEAATIKERIHIIPKVPVWAIDALKNLLHGDPWLVTVMPHAYSFPFRVVITDIVGTKPDDSCGDWIPFYRHHLHNPARFLEWRFYQFDLQTYPNEEVRMMIVNNETNLVLEMCHDRMYVGKLPTNELGYTILLYKLVSTEPSIYQPDREVSDQWKLRILHPEVPPENNHFILCNEKTGAEDLDPTPLRLTRFTGYYIPNDDACICRYTLNVTEPSTCLSVRFETSFDEVELELQIWDLNTQRLVYQREGRGGRLFIPAVYLRSSQYDCDHPSILALGETLEGTKLSEIPGENPENFTLLNPETKQSRHTQQYAIGIFVQGNSWPLTEGEWNFVQKQTKKFGKTMLVFQNKATEHDKLIVSELQKPKSKSNSKVKEEEGPSSEGQAKLATSRSIDSKESGRSRRHNAHSSISPRSRSKKKRIKKSLRKPDSVSREGTEEEEEAEKYEDRIGLTLSDLANVPLDSFDLIRSVEVPSTENMDEKFYESDFEQLSTAQEEISDDEPEFTLKETSYSNVNVVEGGPDSERILDKSQAHWQLEILTDGDSKVEFKSNRRAFRERLIATKLEWEKNQPGRYQNGRTARHRYLARHLVQINHEDRDAYSIVSPMKNFYSCMYYDKEQLDGFNFSHWPDHMKLRSGSQHQPEQQKPNSTLSLEPAGAASEDEDNSRMIEKQSSGPATAEVSQKDGMTYQSTGSIGTGFSDSRRGSNPLGRTKLGYGKYNSATRQIPVATEDPPIDSKDIQSSTTGGISLLDGTETPTTEYMETDYTFDESEGERESHIMEEIISIPGTLDSPASKVPSAMMEVERRHCAPPPRTPTHVLVGPELEKCGIKSIKNDIIRIENLLSDTTAGQSWIRPCTRHAQRVRTRLRFEEWKQDYLQARNDFHDDVESQYYYWLRFKEDLHTTVFCELEANRYFLEQFRENYNDRHAIRTTDRSGNEIALRSMSAIREWVRGPSKILNSREMNEAGEATATDSTSTTAKRPDAPSGNPSAKSIPRAIISSSKKFKGISTKRSEKRML